MKQNKSMITEQMLREYQESVNKNRQQQALEAVNKLNELANNLGFKLIGIPKLENGLIQADWGIEWLK